MNTVQDRRKADRRQTRSNGVQSERRGNDRRTGKDRRESPRLPLELWMEEISADGDVYFRRTGNVSAGGVYFDRAIPHAVGTELTLKFALPGEREMVVARGQVVSTRGGPNGLGMGVKFGRFEGDGQRRIREFLKAN
ncbi:MAG: PilZ domain-containing protein [Myxococcota bacterium]